MNRALCSSVTLDYTDGASLTVCSNVTYASTRLHPTVQTVTVQAVGEQIGYPPVAGQTPWLAVDISDQGVMFPPPVRRQRGINNEGITRLPGQVGPL